MLKSLQEFLHSLALPDVFVQRGLNSEGNITIVAPQETRA